MVGLLEQHETLFLGGKGQISDTQKYYGDWNYRIRFTVEPP